MTTLVAQQLPKRDSRSYSAKLPKECYPNGSRHPSDNESCRPDRTTVTPAFQWRRQQWLRLHHKVSCNCKSLTNSVRRCRADQVHPPRCKAGYLPARPPVQGQPIGEPIRRWHGLPHSQCPEADIKVSHKHRRR